jgi:hypothetical protein
VCVLVSWHLPGQTSEKESCPSISQSRCESRGVQGEEDGGVAARDWSFGCSDLLKLMEIVLPTTHNAGSTHETSDDRTTEEN